MSLDFYRSKFAQFMKEKANLEQDLARERKKSSQIQSDISSIKQSITRSNSSSIQKSKQQQVDSKQKDLAQCQKKIADLETKISAKVADINQTLKKMERVEKQDKKKQDTDAKRRRDEEVRHAQAVTRETERQVYLQKQISNSHLVIDLARLPETIKVLFVASNPLDQNQLRLDEEIRAITEKIRASDYRDSVQLVSRWAARPSDLLQALNELKPHVVHFSGHGSINNELVFQADDGSTKLVSQKAIVTTMSTIADNIRLVVFNACFSQDQAEAVTQHVETAIGMSDAIGDNAAKVFAAQFYSAIGFGRSVKQAFDQGISALLLEGIPEEETPALFTQEGIDSEDIVLVRPVLL
ncbi:MAG: CHAT domain-containing protein [Microcoleus sp.]